jgi:hypothetical protein
MKAYLFRNYEEHQTTGRFILTENEDLLFKAYSLELPNLNNLRSISCIPVGDYICRIENSPSHGMCFHVLNVVNRDYILIHAGNYNKDTEGCILLGADLLDINNDGLRDVTDSIKTVNELENITDEFILTIL